MTKDIYEKKFDLIDFALTTLLIHKFLNLFKNSDPVTIQNLKKFVVFKNYQNGKDLRNILKKDPTISFEDFNAKAKLVNSQYNSHWLKVELDFAKHAKRTIDDFKSFKKNRVPYLKWETMGDHKVRPEHQLLQGIVRPISDNFWYTHQPGYINGVINWNCRCHLVPATSEEISNSFEVENSMQNQIIFPENHPYFKVPERTYNRLMLAVYKF